MQITYLFNPELKSTINKATHFNDSGNHAGFIKSLREVGFTDAEITLLTGISIPEVNKTQEQDNAVKMRRLLDKHLKGSSSINGCSSDDQENLNERFKQIRKNHSQEKSTYAPITIFERAKQLRNK